MASSSATSTRAAIYLHDSPGKPSIAQQREGCQRAASDRGWQIVGEYRDRSTGAYDPTERRPGYDTLLEACQAGQLDSVVCWEFAALAREPRELEDWIEAAEGGLLVVTAAGADLSTDGGRLHARFNASSVAHVDWEPDAAPKTTIRAVVYLRMSRDFTGEELGVDRQRAECQRIAAERGWRVIYEYKDNSIGAFKKGEYRPEYDAMVDAYRIGMFDALVSWDLDRLTRQPRQLEDWIDAAEFRGLLLVTANGEADLSTEAGRMFARIKAAVARAESERKAARQRLAAAQRAELGNPPLGVRLTGYTPKGELIESEAALVRQMFQRFHDGDSLRAIVTWLNETGVPTRRGRPWSPSSVRSILTNPRYCRRSTYNRHKDKPDTWTLGRWPAIVGEDIWVAVNARLEDPRRRKQIGTDRKYLGSGLYLCGLCDSPVVTHGSAAIGLRYRCRAGAHFTRSAYLIDQVVLTKIRERLAQADVADLLTSVEGPEAQAAADEIRRLRARLTQTARDYDADLIDGRRYKLKTARINTQLAAAEAVQQRLAAPSSVGAIVAASDPVAAFDAASLGQRRAVVAFFVTVRLYPAPRGRNEFDPATVKIKPNHS